MRGPRPKKAGTDHSMMRELNRSLVLDLLKQDGPLSRADLARETSLAKPTISAIVEDLVGDGLVREVGMGSAAAGGGRPPMLLAFDERSQFFVGVQVGVRRTNLVVADALGDELERREIVTPDGPAEDAVRTIARLVEELVAASGVDRGRLAAVGVCVPGLVDSRTGVCLLAPNLGWQRVPVRDLLSEELEVPAFVVNTADAAIVVETVGGAAEGAENVVLLYVGRGVGGAVISDGQLYHGSFGLVGEIGHCHVPGATVRCSCGKVGCLEALADGPAIARAASAGLSSGRESQLAGLEDITAVEVAAAAAEGDELATEVLAEAGRALGLAASWLVNLFNPEVLLVGGGVAGAGPALLDPLEAAVHEHTLPQASGRVAIRPWTLGRDAGVRGAVLVALQGSENYYRLMFQG